MNDSTSLNPIGWFIGLKTLNKFEFTTILIMILEVFLSKQEYSVMSSFEAVTSEIIRGLIIMSIGTLLIRWRMGSNDFRFKMIVHILNIIINVQLVTAVIDADAIEGLNDTIIYFIVLISHVSIIIISIMATFSSLDNYTDRMAELSNEVKSGNLSSRITETKFTEDKVLGPLTTLINDILRNTSVLFDQLLQYNKSIEDAYLTLSSSSQQMNSSVNEVANTSQAMSSGATDQARLVSEIVEKIDMANKALVDIINSIEGNTTAVSQIALQTNILALNAGIEASRAGDYGRGFAVVAENVRKLSDESKKSAEQINNVVDQIYNNLLNLFKEIQEDMLNVAAVSEETAASSEEVASVAEELSIGLIEVNSLAEKLSDLFVETKNNMDNIN